MQWFWAIDFALLDPDPDLTAMELRKMTKNYFFLTNYRYVSEPTVYSSDRKQCTVENLGRVQVRKIYIFGSFE